MTVAMKAIAMISWMSRTVPFAASTTRAWQPSHIELLRLYVDDALWSPEDSQWHNLKTKQIKLVRKQGKFEGIYLDDEKVNFVPDSQNCLLAEAVIMGIYNSNDGTVPLDELAENEKIWKNRTMQKGRVRHRLHRVDEVFRGSLTIGEEISVDAEVTVEDE